MTTGRIRRGMLSRTDADTLAEMARLIRTPCAQASPAELAAKRKVAGPSPQQVALLLNRPDITWRTIEMIERGHKAVDDDLARQLDQIYATDPRFPLIGPVADSLVSDNAGDRDGK